MPLKMTFNSTKLGFMASAAGKERLKRQDGKYIGFVKHYWPTVEGVRPFIDNWHLNLIGEHLEACVNRQIRRLLINIPPRCMKSISVAVMLCPWTWGPAKRPYERFVYASYSGDLSARDSRNARRIIRSDEYQEFWGDVFQIRRMDKDSDSRFENNQTGYRMATSINGIMTGEGGNILVWDDPHKADEAQSDAIREDVIGWYKNTFSTRLNNPNEDVEVGVMQRLHERDLSGYVLAEIGGFEHLCIPMEYDGKRRSTVLMKNYDPRQQPGELLWPNRFNRDTVNLLKRKLGTYGSSGQLQQSPAPDEGGLIKKGWLRYWPHQAPLPRLLFILQSYDGAFTENTENDPTGKLVLGVFEYKGQNNVIILSGWTEFLIYPDLRKRAREEYAETYGGHGINRVLIEDKGSGISLRQDLQRAGIPVLPYNPGRMDKKQRVHLASPLIEAGLVWIHENADQPGEPAEWMKPIRAQWCSFPNAEHDEYVDCLTQALIYLHNTGWIKIDANIEFDDDAFYVGESMTTAVEFSAFGVGD